MVLRSTTLLALTVICLFSTTSALSALDIPADTPVNQLVSSANSHLAKAEFNEALSYFDVAISRDPKNYLTLFKRGATYLSLGKNVQATQDFDRVLIIKPGFEGALLQRAKIKAKSADWAGAKQDYVTAGKREGQEVSELEEAQQAASAAFEAGTKSDWETCITQAGTAIMTASTALALRQLRARCRFERGEIQEGVSDLAHVLQISPGLIEPHLQISSMLFFSLGDTERGLAQIRRCLHFDPDSTPCSKLFRREKLLDKEYTKVKKFMEKRQFSSAAKLLVGSGEDVGLTQDVRDEIKSFKDQGIIHQKAPDEFITQLVELTCQAYYEMGSYKKAITHCTLALSLQPTSLYGLLSSAHTASSPPNPDPEAAIKFLDTALEHHPSAQGMINPLLQKAQIALKKLKTKDYYAVLGVAHDADPRTIKRAYRQLVKQHHPDKAKSRGVTKEQAEKRMSSINEAYEVLSDPELRERVDRGEDPNDPTSNQGGNPFQGSPFGHGQGGQQQFFFQHGQGFPQGGGGGGGGGFKFQFP